MRSNPPAALVSAKGGSASRELAGIMALIGKHGSEVIGRALEMAIRRECFSTDAVACIATAMLAPEPASEPLDRQKHPGIPVLPPFDVDLKRYDVLIAGRCAGDAD